MSLRTVVSCLATLAVAVTSLAVTTEAAQADLRICNATTSRVQVAIGYRTDRQWTTEGWWTVPSQSCEVLLRGPLTARYYYIYAIDNDVGGEWSGESDMCTRDEEFTIRGHERCEERGFISNSFIEVDTGEEPSWTVQLVEPDRRQRN
ncbi:MAG: DUF1036 domain-containing protein [Pseudomonadota bacterium]